MNAEIEAKIRMIRLSLRCYVCGMLALLPCLGAPFAVAALILSGRARVGEKRFWNVARHYRELGVIGAAFGIVFWSLILCLFIYRSVHGHEDSSYWQGSD